MHGVCAGAEELNLMRMRLLRGLCLCRSGRTELDEDEVVKRRMSVQEKKN